MTRTPYDTLLGAGNKSSLETLTSAWEEFLEVSKSQTFLEVFLTTRLQRSHFRKDHLVGPPPYQIIALHPQVIYENLDKAADGSQMELGLALELIGINFWNWKIPFGASITSVYVDRAGVRNTGIGVMFHIDNKYSIGWADHGGDNGIFVTMDLLKVFQKNKALYDEYANR